MSDSSAGRPLLVLLVAVLVAACGSSSPSSSPTDQAEASTVSFADVFADRLALEELDPKQVCPTDDAVAQRILDAYGAVFVTSTEVGVMPRCVFETAEEVVGYQDGLATESAMIGGKEVELQAQAFAALEAARSEAVEARLTITPRGPFPAARDFDTTVELWSSRVGPALDFWLEAGQLDADEVARVRAAEPPEQVEAVLAFEDRGLFFSTDFDQPILASVAAPGTSQHLSLLAFDVVEHADERVRAILAAHGWFATVVGDPPHFTFLGFDEDELPARGLERVVSDGREYWVPAR